MSDDPPALHRRTFVRGTGAAAVGAAGMSGVATAQTDGGDDGDDDDDDGGNGRGRGRGADRGAGRGGGASDVRLIAHRGFAGVYPENTVEAVRNASRGWTPERRRRLADAVTVESFGDGEAVVSYEEGSVGPLRRLLGGDPADAAHRRADVVEVDVMPTGDGDVVVFHDNGLSERDGGERGLTDADDAKVFETDTETVVSAEVLDSGETVPLLTEVMDAVPSDVAVNLEFKNPGSREESLRFGETLDGDALAAQREIWRPFTEDVLAVAADYDNEILVSSFYEAALATVREVDPAVPVAFLFWNDVEAGLDVTDTYDCEAMNVPFNMVRGTPFFSDEVFGFDNVPEGGYADVDLVAAAEERGIDLNVWTVRNWYEADQLRRAGVDGLISDFPNLL
jgi:glycerophosphoryl diester phosphodiesterase